MRIPGVNLALNTLEFGLMLLDELWAALNPPLEQAEVAPAAGPWASVDEIPL